MAHSPFASMSFVEFENDDKEREQIKRSMHVINFVNKRVLFPLEKTASTQVINRPLKRSRSAPDTVTPALRKKRVRPVQFKSGKDLIEVMG
jgi:hypothetical protein